MKATYKNAIRSKQLIKHALVTLLDKKGSISEITVSDICHEANINRGTFYNHYGNTTDVLEEIKDELMSKLTNNLKMCAEKNSLDTFVDTAIEHIEKNEKEYRKIINIIPLSVIIPLKQEFVRQIKTLNICIDETNLYFVVNAIAGVYLDFLKGTLNIPYSKLNEKTKEFLKKNLM